MNFTILSRNSTAGPIYTDRPSMQYTSTPQPWKKTPYDSHHLNPSKSKLNIRSSLNKTNENISYSNHNIDNIRASCFISNSISTYQHLKKQSFLEDKNNKPTKEKNESSFEGISKDSLYRCSTVTPTSVFGDEDRKKIQSSFLRGSLKEAGGYKIEQDNYFGKETKVLDDIKGQIIALTKRVFINEEEISKLKQKRQKDKKIQILQQQFTQFQIQMFDILKKNSNFFSDFQSKIQKNSSLINQIRQRVFNSNENDDLQKRLSIFDTRIIQLTEQIRTKEEISSKAMTSLLALQQNQIKNMINDQVYEINSKLDKKVGQTHQLLSKLSRLNEQVKEKEYKVAQYRKDNRKSYSSMMVQNKQILIIREDDIIKNTKQHTSFQLTTRKECQDHFSKYDTPHKQNRQTLTQNKRQIIIKHKIYYIDSQGFLLDQNKYYLLNSKNQQIMIDDTLLSCLRENNMLINPAPAPLSTCLLNKR